MSTDTVLVIIGCTFIISALLGRVIFPNIKNLQISITLRISISILGLVFLSIGIFPIIPTLVKFLLLLIRKQKARRKIVNLGRSYV